MGDIAFLVIDLFLLAVAGITAVAVIQVRSLFASVILAGIYSLIMALIWQASSAVDVSFTEAAVGAGISTILLLGALVFCGREEKAGSQRVHWPALGVVVLTGAALIYGTFDMPRFGDPQSPLHTHRTPAMLTQRVGKVFPLPGEQEKWPGEYSVADHGFAPGVQVRGDEWVGYQHWVMPPEPDAGSHPISADEHGHHHAESSHSETGQAVESHDGHARHAHPQDDWDGHVPNIVTSLLAGYRSFDTMFETAVIFSAGMSLVLLLRRRRKQSPDTKVDRESVEVPS